MRALKSVFWYPVRVIAKYVSSLFPWMLLNRVLMIDSALDQ